MKSNVYFCIRREIEKTPTPAVFLDRDGVIIEDTGYLHRATDLRYIPGAAESIALLNGEGIPVILVTNQAGIGRMLYGWAQFEEVQKQIDLDLALQGAHLDGVWACAAHPKGIGEFEHPSHPFRKPNPGMIHDAAESMGLDLDRSWLIGDKPLDIEAGLRVGLAGVCHVQTGYGSATRDEARRLHAQYPNAREFVASASICDAVQYILRKLHR